MPSDSRDHALHPLLQQQKRVTANWCPWAHATRSGSNRSLAGISSITKATPSKTRWFIYSWMNSNKTKSKHTHRESKTGISKMIVWKMCFLFEFAKFQGALYIFCKCKHDLANAEKNPSETQLIHQGQLLCTSENLNSSGILGVDPLTITTIWGIPNRRWTVAMKFAEHYVSTSPWTLSRSL